MWPFRHRGRPRLSVSFQTRDSAERLAQRIAEAAAFADEIVVGVDAASVDDTLAVACKLADVVYRFHHEGDFAGVRMLPFDFARGDWILSLDDDESMEGDFAPLAAELLAQRQLTHCLFPRKWIVEAQPPRCLNGPPWFPDWQLRLFRNDRQLAWKPNRPHTGYYIMGPGAQEERAAILHWEPILCSAEARARKLERYRESGGDGVGEGYYASPASVPRRPTQPPAAAIQPRRKRRTFQPADCKDVFVKAGTGHPPWGVSFLACFSEHHGGAPIAPSQRFAVEMAARNTGRLAWWPRAGRWPRLFLVASLLDADGNKLVDEVVRTPVARPVACGETIHFLATVPAPAEPGSYQLRWDMLSAKECLFSACGSMPMHHAFTVQASADAPPAVSPVAQVSQILAE